MRGLGSSAVAVAALAVSTAASGAGRPATGRILFATDRAPDLHRAQLFEIGVDGRSRRQLKPRLDAAFLTMLSRSRDGRRTALVREPQGRLVVVGPGGVRQLARPVLAWGTPAFSRDGRWLAFSGDLGQNQNGIFVARLDRKGFRRVVDEIALAPSWSANGRRIAYAGDWEPVHGQTQSVFVVGVDGRGRTKISASFSAPAWAPRGDVLAFTGAAGRSRCQGVCVATGNGRRVRSLARRASFAGWLPEGRSVLYSVDGSDALWVVGIDGRRRRMFTRTRCSPEPTGWSWSHDGRRLACATAGGIAIVDRRTGAARMLRVGADTIELAYIRWSADDRRLTYAEYLNGNDYEIASIRPDGASVRLLTHNFVDDRQPQASRDGGTIAFARTTGGFSRIFVMNADGTGERPLLEAASGTWDSHPAWSPDGTRIAFIRRTSLQQGYGVLEVARTRGGGVQALATPPVRGSRISWSSDDVIAFAAERGVYTVRPDGTDLEAVPNALGTAPSWSPDGKTLVFETPALTLLDRDGANLRVIGPQPTDLGGAAWAPDGRRLVYADGNGYESADLALVEPFPYAAPSQLTSAEGSDIEPSWMP